MEIKVINITVDYDNNKIIIQGVDDMGNKINSKFPCKNMDGIQKILYEILNLISPTNVDVNLYGQDEGRTTLIESW